MTLDQLPANMRTKIELRPCTDPDLPGHCWHWTRCANSKGYGCVGINGKSQLTHRVSYALLVGPIPAGLQLDHLCRNKRCCNPQHLEVVTGKVNCERTPRATKAHCIRNHPLSGDNLIIKVAGSSKIRNCRICTNERRRAARKAVAS